MMTGLPGRSAVTVIDYPAWVWDGYTGSGDREYPAQLLPGDRCEHLGDRMDLGSRCHQDASWWLLTLIEWHADQQWEALCDDHARSHPHLWRMDRSGDRPYALLHHTDPLMRPSECEDCWEDQQNAHEAGRPVSGRQNAEYIIRVGRRTPMRFVCGSHADRYMITMSDGRTAPATHMGHRFWGRLDGRRHWTPPAAAQVVDDQPSLFTGVAS